MTEVPTGHSETVSLPREGNDRPIPDDPHRSFGTSVPESHDPLPEAGRSVTGEGPLREGTAPTSELLGLAETIAPRDTPSPPGGLGRHRGGYVLGEVIGTGGLGQVVRAVHLPLGRVVAVKRLRRRQDDRQSQPAALTAFRLEALINANLEHPNIVPVYDIGEGPDGESLLAMKLMKGGNWSRLIDEEFHRLDPSEFLARNLPILIAVCQAVAFAHSRGIVHRDLKPSQVMVGEFGEVALMDWGLALVYDDALLPPEVVAAFGEKIPLRGVVPNPAGTICYMAPEQTFDSSSEIGPCTDIFLLGGILYTLLTGKPPHEAPDSRLGFLRASICEVLPPAEVVENRHVPPELSALAMKALEREPDRRPADVREFIAGIEEYLSGASKRRESHRLTLRVSERLTHSRGDYSEFGDSIAILASAEALWPSNPDIAALRNRVVVAFVMDAIANRDITLAQVHLASLPAGDTRAELESRLAAAVRTQRAEGRRRRAVLYVLVAAVIALAGALAWVAVRADHEIALRDATIARLAGGRR